MDIKRLNKFSKKYGYRSPIIDTVQEEKKYAGSLDYRPDILEQAQACWESMRSVREEGRRNNRFVYGNQLGDYTKVWDDERQMWINIREDAALLRQGIIPITNNVIRSIISTFSNLYISNMTEPVAQALTRDKQTLGELMSSTIQSVYSYNELYDLYRDILPAFLIYGYVAGECSYRFKDTRKNILYDNIRYDRLILDNTIEDFRGFDCKIIGSIKDMPLVDIVAIFSENNPEKAQRIKSAYSFYNAPRNVNYDNREDEEDIVDFFTPTGVNSNMERVYCIWRKEIKERLLVHDRYTGKQWRAELTALPRINSEIEKRKLKFAADGIAEEDMYEGLISVEYIFDDYWAYYFLTPNGYVLSSGETPHNDNVCPIVFKCDLGADGKIRPFVSSTIDQQKLINRNISVNDYVTRVTAKGLLVYDDDALPDNTTIADIQAKAAVPGATIQYKSGGGEAPRLLTNNATNNGALDMIRLELDLLEKITGVGTALLGQAPKSGTSGTLYAQQSQNSAGQLSLPLDKFRQFREAGARLIAKFILQYYDKRMYIPVHGTNDLLEFDPKELNGIDFNVEIRESQSSPLFRAAANDMLMQFVQMGAISPKMALQLGSFAFADKAVQMIDEEQQKALEQQQKMGGMQQLTQ